MAWPETLTINTRTEAQQVVGSLSEHAKAWILRSESLKIPQFLKPPPDADLSNWRDSRVGWGLILPEKDELSTADKIAAADVSEPIRALLKARENARVFRYCSSPGRDMFLRDYDSCKDIVISGSGKGIQGDKLPQYLLIYGTPAEIPWRLQYILNTTCFVGRLDLDGEALENYVRALLSDWENASAKFDRALVWAVNCDEMTNLMRNAIAAKVYHDLNGDSDLQGNVQFIDGSVTQASCNDLIVSLSKHKPGLVISTSHGQTGPLDAPGTLKSILGLPIDQNFQTLKPEDLLKEWEPDGAIWYAHACCSAGGDSVNYYAGLVDDRLNQVLQTVANLGSLIAPLPKILLGAKKPLRAFIGQVEPTFNWMLQQPKTGQFLTDSLRKSLYNNLYRPKPVGLAFHNCYQPIGTLYTQYDTARQAYPEEGMLECMLYSLLVTRNLQSMVILGDPTVILPPLVGVRP